MSRAELTISIDSELADYLRSTSSVNSTIAEAVTIYRDLELEQQLTQAYQEGTEEPARIDSEWSALDRALRIQLALQVRRTDFKRIQLRLE